MINILRELCRNKKGRIEGVSMADMLQLIWLEKMSCSLRVRCNGELGTLKILDGELKNASTRSQSGQDAAMEILRWQDVVIELDDSGVPDAQELDVSTEEMLWENIRRSEDKKKDTSKYRIRGSGGDKAVGDGQARTHVSELGRSVNILKENLGEALLAADIWGSADMRSVAGWNTQPEATALFSQLSQSISRALEGMSFPGLGKYLIFNLVDEIMIVIIPMGELAWGMLVDGKKTQLGLLLNVALPKAIAAFADAVDPS